jgi:serine/threonine-protein kinase
MAAIVEGQIPPLSRWWPDVPPALEGIVRKALSSSPDDRYATADDMRLALEAFAADTGLRTSTTALADYMKMQFGHRAEPWLVDDDEPEIEIIIGSHVSPRPVRRWWRWVAGGVGAVMTIAATIIVMLASSDKPAAAPGAMVQSIVLPSPIEAVPAAMAAPAAEAAGRGPDTPAAPEPEPARRAKKHRQPPKPERSKKHWNPNTLFPK